MLETPPMFSDIIHFWLEKLNSEFLNGIHSFFHSQIYILGYKMPSTMLSVWDTMRNNTTQFLLPETAFNCSACVYASTFAYTNVLAYTHIPAMCVLRNWNEFKMEEQFLAKATNMSRWNPNSLYINYVEEQKTGPEGNLESSPLEIIKINLILL